MSDWTEKAACAGHENPELWCRQSEDPIAGEAREICLASCKVRLECGEWALSTGARDIVAGGYRTWNRADMKRLQDELPGVAVAPVKRTQSTYECLDCAAQFTSTRSSEQCVACRKGLVPAEPVREWIHALREAGMKTGEIAVLAGLKSNSISGIVAKSNAPEWVRASTSERIRAIKLPLEAVSV